MNAITTRQECSTPSYWVNHTIVRKLGQLWQRNYDLHPISISVVGDPILRKGFSGIQLIIATTVSAGALHDRVELCITDDRILSQLSTTTGNRRSTIDRNLPSLALILEAKPHAHVQRFTIIQSDASLLQQPGVRFLAEKYFHFPIDEADSTPSPLAFTSIFRSSHPLTSSDGLEYQLHSTFHIIPTRSTDQTSCFNRLPRNVLLKIADMICDDIAHIGYTRYSFKHLHDILFMSLVCSAWRVVLEVYYEWIGKYYRHNHIHNLEKLVKFVEHKPRMCLYITRLVYLGESCDICAKLIALCPAIDYLRITYPTYWLSRVALESLSMVKTFILEPPPFFNRAANVEAPTTLQVCEVIKQWAQLEEFETYVFSSPPSGIRMMEPVSSAISLKSLTVRNAYGNDGRPFVHTESLYSLLTPTPTLRSLRLVGVQGVSKTDLCDLLLYLSSTLEDLEIVDSRRSWATSGYEDYQAPIDEVIPYLTKIRSVAVDSPFATPLAISGKSSCIGNEPSSCSQFTWTVIGAIDLEAITHAIEVTGWSSIHISAQVDSREEAINVAEALQHWRDIGKGRGVSVDGLTWLSDDLILAL